jgi:hypothetical protein
MGPEATCTSQAVAFLIAAPISGQPIHHASDLLDDIGCRQQTPEGSKGLSASDHSSSPLPPASPRPQAGGGNPDRVEN